MVASGGDWIRTYHPGSGSGCRLVCLPHAGGSASFYLPVSRALAGAAEVLCVQYPGRQDRRFEAPIGRIEELADRVAEVLLPVFEAEPMAFFGHSMGAVVAFEVVRRLEAGIGRSAAALFASGRRAPGVVARRAENVHQWSDADIIQEMRRLSGTESALFEDAELLQAVLPAIRSDYRAIETYQCPTDAVVGCPLVALVGTQDPRVTVEEAAAWEQHTSESFELLTFPGGHFYLTAQADAVIDQVRRRLPSVAGRPAA